MLSPLTQACVDGDLNRVLQLYRLGIFSLETPLLHACFHDRLQICKLLVERGANIHASEDVCFRIACLKGNLEVAMWLHSLGGTDLNARCGEVWKSKDERVIMWLKSL